MQREELSPEELGQLSPEAQTAWFSERVENWTQFVDDITASHAELEAHRAAGKPAFPADWISHREYMKQRGLRSDPYAAITLGDGPAARTGCPRT